MAERLSLPKLAAKIPDEVSAYRLLEEMRWGEDRQVCPHCASIGGHYFLKPKNGGRKTRTGAITQRRLWKCRECRKQFTVLVGTIFHRTKIPVRTWLLVLFDMMSAKNGISAREVARKYELSEEAAWFACHRIREAMKRDPLAGLLSGTVIADETWIGGKPRNLKNPKRFAQDHYGNKNKTPVLSLVDRENGEVRSKVIPNVRRNTLRAAIEADVDLPATNLHTDTAMAYTQIGWRAASHETVNHTMSEYVRDGVTTNHAEGFFAQLKRSIDGTHHAVSTEHLPRYLAEFDFRYNTRKLSDTDRMARLLGQVHGRRLTYRPLTGRA